MTDKPAEQAYRAGRCNRCQANLCDHDNCTDWTCARACSKCAKGPCHENPSAELTALRAAAASQGVNLTKANIAGYVKGFKAAQEYEKLGAEQGRGTLQAIAQEIVANLGSCDASSDLGFKVIWATLDRHFGTGPKQTEQAYHARGAGREERKFEEVLELHVNSSESMRETYRRTANSDMENFQEGFTEGVRRAIEVYGNWRIAREPGADTGTTPTPFSEVIDAWQAANHATGSLADMLDSLKEFASVYRAAERGTTPPEGLWLTGERLEQMHTEYTTGPDPETMDTNWDDLAGDIRVAAATQRASVEQGPKLTCQKCGREYDLQDKYADRDFCSGVCHNAFHAADDSYKNAAPDHAREGALRERLLGEPLGDLSFSERLAEKMCNLLTDKFTNSVKIAAGIIKQELEQALADGKEGGE